MMEFKTTSVVVKEADVPHVCGNGQIPTLAFFDPVAVTNEHGHDRWRTSCIIPS